MNDLQWRLKTYASEHLPKLSWVATAPLRGGEITVLHGSFVETSDEWVVEGCWDDVFFRGDFHESENFFGSGVRLTNQKVVFSSSIAMVDRLIYAYQGDNLIVSNSLLLMLAVTGARLDYEHDYHDECYGMLKGIKDYYKEFRVLHNEIETFYQLYSSRLILTENGITSEPIIEQREIASYQDYIQLIDQALLAIKDNATSNDRKHKLVFHSTLSSGYDSTAVTCLGKRIGIDKCFTTVPSQRGKSRNLENGKRIADKLNLETVLLDADDSSVSENEPWFLAPTYEGSEIIFDKMIRYIDKENKPVVVLTGYHGDKIWDRNSKGKYLSDEIIRGDTSGLNLSEVRLKAGFINLAIPFMYARSAKDIVAVANQEEMEPWQTNSDYDRPMPRRIAETKGIPRDWFGQKKKAVLNYYSKPVNLSCRRKFNLFLKKKMGLNAITLASYEATEYFDYLHIRILRMLRPSKDYKEVPWSLRRWVFKENINLRLFMFLWACSQLTDELRSKVRQTTPRPIDDHSSYGTSLSIEVRDGAQ